MKNYIIISGSTRIDSQSAKVSAYLAKALAAIDMPANVDIIDLAKVELPHWNEDFWQEEIPDSTWCELSALIDRSDGVIIVTPEWNGMVPPALMNLFLLASRAEFSHKPTLIVSVSASNGGAYPVSQLRSFGYKNNQVCYVPDHLIIRNVNDILNGDDYDDEKEGYIRDRIEYSLSVFKVYTHAFDTIKNSEIINLERYPYGM